MELDYTIALAKSHHVAALPGIELSVATMLEGHAPASVLEETTPEGTFQRGQRDGRLWVALADDIPVSFALVQMLARIFPTSRRRMCILTMVAVGSVTRCYERFSRGWSSRATGR